MTDCPWGLWISVVGNLTIAIYVLFERARTQRELAQLRAEYGKEAIQLQAELDRSARREENEVHLARTLYREFAEEVEETLGVEPASPRSPDTEQLRRLLERMRSESNDERVVRTAAELYLFLSDLKLEGEMPLGNDLEELRSFYMERLRSKARGFVLLMTFKEAVAASRGRSGPL
ncbi:MAG: hypothetical protein AAGA81_11915 [Acidobacteriota bacterium]